MHFATETRPRLSRCHSMLNARKESTSKTFDFFFHLRIYSRKRWNWTFSPHSQISQTSLASGWCDTGFRKSTLVFSSVDSCVFAIVLWLKLDQRIRKYFFCQHSLTRSFSDVITLTWSFNEVNYQWKKSSEKLMWSIVHCEANYFSLLKRQLFIYCVYFFIQSLLKVLNQRHNRKL